MIGSPVIRKASLVDLETVASLGGRTFSDAFETLYSPEDLALFIAENHTVEAYRSVLGNPDITLWLAEDEGVAIGYCQVGPNSLPCDPPLPNALELSRLYVDKNIQNSGLGSRFIEKVIALAKAQGNSSIVLSVWSENHGGHKLYRRFGFEKIADYKFRVGNHYDEEYIFQKTL